MSSENSARASRIFNTPPPTPCGPSRKALQPVIESGDSETGAQVAHSCVAWTPVNPPHTPRIVLKRANAGPLTPPSTPGTPLKECWEIQIPCVTSGVLDVTHDAESGGEEELRGGGRSISLAGYALSPGYPRERGALVVHVGCGSEGAGTVEFWTEDGEVVVPLNQQLLQVHYEPGPFSSVLTLWYPVFSETGVEKRVVLLLQHALEPTVWWEDEEGDAENEQQESIEEDDEEAWEDIGSENEEECTEEENWKDGTIKEFLAALVWCIDRANGRCGNAELWKEKKAMQAADVESVLPEGTILHPLRAMKRRSSEEMERVVSKRRHTEFYNDSSENRKIEHKESADALEHLIVHDPVLKALRAMEYSCTGAQQANLAEDASLREGLVREELKRIALSIRHF